MLRGARSFTRQLETREIEEPGVANRIEALLSHYPG